ncbi:MAG: tetratricopeptide repeat protein [Myxococcales bacterium]|nr:MAG: tetratricopeptide repeat protein [Myxococcales bacterium]
MASDPALDAAHWDAVEEATELIQEGQFQNALYVLREVVRADGRNPYAYYFMGVALYELAQLEPARDAYRAAVRLAPSYVGARGSLAQVLRRLGDHRGAIREAREGLNLRPDDPDSLHAAGMAHAALDHRSEARRYLEAFLRTKPEVEAAQEARLSLASLDRGMGPIDIDLTASAR